MRRSGTGGLLAHEEIEEAFHRARGEETNPVRELQAKETFGREGGGFRAGKEGDGDRV